MRVYTIYSDSHKELFELFKSHLGDWANLSAHKAPQLCSGDYPGSVEFWRYNLNYFIDICTDNFDFYHKIGHPFLYLDCDVITLQDPTKDLEIRAKGSDLLAQFDKRVFGFPQICTGIMYIKPTWEILKMLYRIRDPRKWKMFSFQSPIYKYGNDQKAINRHLLYHWGVRWDILPKTYYSINFDNGNKVWDGKELKIKKRDYKMIHLNWCIGNKLKLWREIENRI